MHYPIHFILDPQFSMNLPLGDENTPKIQMFKFLSHLGSLMDNIPYYFDRLTFEYNLEHLPITRGKAQEDFERIGQQPMTVRSRDFLTDLYTLLEQDVEEKTVYIMLTTGVDKRTLQLFSSYGDKLMFIDFCEKPGRFPDYSNYMQIGKDNTIEMADHFHRLFVSEYIIRVNAITNFNAELPPVEDDYGAPVDFDALTVVGKADMTLFEFYPVLASSFLYPVGNEISTLNDGTTSSLRGYMHLMELLGEKFKGTPKSEETSFASSLDKTTDSVQGAEPKSEEVTDEVKKEIKEEVKEDENPEVEQVVANEKKEEVQNDKEEEEEEVPEEKPKPKRKVGRPPKKAAQKKPKKKKRGPKRRRGSSSEEPEVVEPVERKEGTRRSSRLQKKFEEQMAEKEAVAEEKEPTPPPVLVPEVIDKETLALNRKKEMEAIRALYTVHVDPEDRVLFGKAKDRWSGIWRPVILRLRRLNDDDKTYYTEEDVKRIEEEEKIRKAEEEAEAAREFLGDPPSSPTFDGPASPGDCSSAPSAIPQIPTILTIPTTPTIKAIPTEPVGNSGVDEMDTPASPTPDFESSSLKRRRNSDQNELPVKRSKEDGSENKEDSKEDGEIEDDSLENEQTAESPEGVEIEEPNFDELTLASCKPMITIPVDKVTDDTTKDGSDGKSKEDQKYIQVIVLDTTWDEFKDQIAVYGDEETIEEVTENEKILHGVPQMHDNTKLTGWYSEEALQYYVNKVSRALRRLGERLPAFHTDKVNLEQMCHYGQNANLARSFAIYVQKESSHLPADIGAVADEASEHFEQISTQYLPKMREPKAPKHPKAPIKHIQRIHDFPQLLPVDPHGCEITPTKPRQYM